VEATLIGVRSNATLGIAQLHRVVHNSIIVLQLCRACKPQSLVEGHGVNRRIYRKTTGVSPIATLSHRDFQQMLAYAALVQLLCDEQVVNMTVVANADEANDLTIHFRNVIGETV